MMQRAAQKAPLSAGSRDASLPVISVGLPEVKGSEVTAVSPQYLLMKDPHTQDRLTDRLTD